MWRGFNRAGEPVAYTEGEVRRRQGLMSAALSRGLIPSEQGLPHGDRVITGHGAFFIARSPKAAARAGRQDVVALWRGATLKGD